MYAGSLCDLKGQAGSPRGGRGSMLLVGAPGKPYISSEVRQENQTWHLQTPCVRPMRVPVPESRFLLTKNSWPQTKAG